MELFHVLNRGVDRRDIFMDDQDRYRFIHDLFEFNTQDWVQSTHHTFSHSPDLASRDIRKPRKLVVNIHAFCMMSNHYHLLLSPKVDDGIVRFMRKLNMGYAKYFNKKYDRTGALFEGRYKSVHVTRQAHFIHLPYYIHCNPLDFAYPEWRDRKIKNYQGAMKFLDGYRWSSFQDYSGKKNFPSLLRTDFLKDVFGGPTKHRDNVEEWLRDMDTSRFSDVVLE